ILEKHLLPLINKKFNGKRYLFQDDNDDFLDKIIVEVNDLFLKRADYGYYFGEITEEIEEYLMEKRISPENFFELVNQERYSNQYPNLFGFCYERGIGNTMDWKKAKLFYERSEESGDHYGEWLLGYMYLNNHETMDVNKGLFLCKKSADAGNARAQLILAEFYAW
ncbi:466_t:CDS:1, partial [Ambispora leptoticha]